MYRVKGTLETIFERASPLWLAALLMQVLQHARCQPDNRLLRGAKDKKGKTIDRFFSGAVL